MRARRAGSLVAALAASAMGVAACGESAKPLTRAQLLVKGDAICRRINKKVSSISIKSQKELARVLPELAGYEQQSLAELSKLIPPAAMANDWKTIVTGAQTIADTTVRLTDAAKKKDLKTAHSLIVEIGNVQKRTNEVAKRDGFKDCSQAP